MNSASSGLGADFDHRPTRMPSWIVTPLILGAFFFFTAKVIGDRGQRGPTAFLTVGLALVGGLVFMTLYAGEFFSAAMIVAIVGGVTFAGFRTGRRIKQKRLERVRAPLRAIGASAFATAAYAGGVPGFSAQGVELYTDRTSLWFVPLHTADDARLIALQDVVDIKVREHLRVTSELDLAASYAFGGAGYRVTSDRLGAVVVTWQPTMTQAGDQARVAQRFEAELGTVGVEAARQLHAILVTLVNQA